MTDYYRAAVRAAVRDHGGPPATPEERSAIASSVYDYLVNWGVFRLVDGELRGGPRLLDANRSYARLVR